ncbi:DNA (cytosine-5-)-methyltransferase [Plasmodium inui San Antonio 1]|uniref:DNA (Cytosine-5-)-methyltransferase n=1 Tax=Plasmodium inui San Antonio 1 TaxID=1237626 RepID=W6ZW89_9APIC|nr:DNA (cytosine-5-)-methyltransferase [Plasmodium inui San Antonio 1]EUD65022.1 DNA (cytosine-5-)-methyltransferase [Plasmodium inui San Antonio 1]
MQRSGVSKNDAHGRVTPQPVLSNGMIRKKKEILENAFTDLREKPTASEDKQFASFLPSCGGIEGNSEGGERKSTHKGSNKRNVDTKEAKRGNKGFESCNDLANGKIEGDASFHPPDGDKSKCTNGGDLTKYTSKIWCSKESTNVPKLDSGLALTLPNRGEDLPEMIDKRGVAKNGKVDRKKKEGRRINLNKKRDHLERDASEFSRDTLPGEEESSHLSLQIGGASILGHSSLNEERKKGSLPSDEPKLESNETNTSLRSELKDSKMSRKHICKSSTILSPRKRLSKNQKSSEKIAHGIGTSDSSNGLEKRRMFIEHSRRKTVYNGEPKKKRLRKNEEKLKKCSMDSFDRGKGNNFTREKEKVDREKWENKSNSGRFEEDSSKGNILERKKKKAKLPLSKGSKQFVSCVNSRGNKKKAGKYQGGKLSSVESLKCDTDQRSSRADLRPNFEEHHRHGSKKNDEKVLEETPLGMFKFSKKRLHFCSEGDEEKRILCEKHRSYEKVESDQKGEYFFSDKCREIHSNMADKNLKNRVRPDIMSKSLLGGGQDNQYAGRGEGSTEEYSYVAIEQVSKNGAHNFYFEKSRYTSLRGKYIRRSGLGEGWQTHSEADLSDSVRSSRIGYFSGGEQYSGCSHVEGHYDARNDGKYRSQFFYEMHEGGNFAGEVDFPREDSLLKNGNRSGSKRDSRRGSRRGQDDLYLAFQESTPKGEKSLPDELLQSQPPPSTVESEHRDDAHLRRREYVQGQICRILKKENWDGEAESLLNLFFRYVKVEERCDKNGHTLIRKNIERDKKGIRKGGGEKGNRTEVWKQKQQKAELGRGEGVGVDKLNKVYLDDAPKSLPLTMLIVRNYDEGHLHHGEQRKKRNEEGRVNEKVSVRYKVELTGVKNPMGMKEAVEKEKKLFSRIERIYDFCASDGEGCGEARRERRDNNMGDSFIPFPNMGWSCSKEGYQDEVISVHSAWAEERKHVFFDDEGEKHINADMSHMSGKGLMPDDALLRVPKKGGINNSKKFGKTSPFSKWNVNVCTKLMKQPGGKNALVKKGSPKGVSSHLDKKASLKCFFSKAVPVVGGKPKGIATQIGTFKKSSLPRKSALEGSYPKSKDVKWGGGHHVTNFKEYLTEMRNKRGGNKTKKPSPKDGKERKDSRNTQWGSPISGSIGKIVDDKNDEEIITDNFFPPTGIEPNVVKREIGNRPKGELDSYRQLKKSSGDVFKRGGSKRKEHFNPASQPPRDVLDPLGSAHNGSQKCRQNAVESKDKVGFYKDENFTEKKEHKEGENEEGISNTFEEPYARKNNRDGDHPSRSFKMDGKNCKAIENDAKSLDEGGSSGKPPQREGEPTSNKTEEGTKTLHPKGRSEKGLSSPSKDGKRKKEEKGSYHSRRSDGVVDNFHPSVIERFYDLSERSKVGKKEAKESRLEEEVEERDLEQADTLNKEEGWPQKLVRSIQVASPRRNPLRRKGALTGGKSISHFVSKHGKEKEQNCDLDPSEENRIARGRDKEANTAKGFNKKSEFYHFTNLGKNVEENISPLMVAEEEGDPLKSHQGRSPVSSVSNKNEIRLTRATPSNGTSHMFNAPREEGTHEGNNPKGTTNLVGRRISSPIARRGKPFPPAMGSFPHKMTLSEMDKSVLKNEKRMTRNSNYVDLRHMKCSMSTLEFFLEKRYLKRNSPGEGKDSTEGQKKKEKKKKKKKDISLVCNQSEGQEVSKRFAMSKRGNAKKMSNRNIAIPKGVPETDQFPNLSCTEGGKGGPSIGWPPKSFIEKGKKEKERRVSPPPSASSSGVPSSGVPSSGTPSSGAPSSRRSAATTSETPAANLTQGAEKREASKFSQMKGAHTACTLRLNDETKATSFAYHLLTHKKDETKRKRPSHVYPSKSSLSYRLTNLVRVKRNIYLSDSHVRRSPGMDSMGREDAGGSFTSEEEETQSERGVEKREEAWGGDEIGQTEDNKSYQPTATQKDNHEDAGKIATTLCKAPGEKTKQTDHLLTIKVNIITVFLHSSYVKRMNMDVSYNIQVTIYWSSDRKTIEKNCRKETFPCYFTSHTSGIGLSSDAFKKIDAMCESESRQFFKLVVSCRRERSFLKKEFIRIYSRTFQAPIELKTYILSRNKKYASETESSNDELYEMNGNAAYGCEGHIIVHLWSSI